MTSRTSRTPAVTAESSTNRRPDDRAIAWASVVLPVPGGPHRITDVAAAARRPDRRAVTSGEPGRSRWRLAGDLVERGRSHPDRERGLPLEERGRRSRIQATPRPTLGAGTARGLAAGRATRRIIPARAQTGEQGRSRGDRWQGSRRRARPASGRVSTRRVRTSISRPGRGDAHATTSSPASRGGLLILGVVAAQTVVLRRRSRRPAPSPTSTPTPTTTPTPTDSPEPTPSRRDPDADPDTLTRRPDRPASAQRRRPY